MTPHRLTEMGFENPNGHDNITTGLRLVGKGTRAFMSGWDVTDGQNYLPGSGYLWELISKPAGSAATLDSTTAQWTSLLTDLTGTYTVRLTVGGVDTSVDIIAANYIGVDKDDVSGGTAFTCATCHVFAKPEVFSSWKESGHAKKFEKGMNGDNGAGWGESCFKCHTTGYNLSADNGGFDDIQQAVGYVDTVWKPWRPGLYDSMLTTDKKMMSLLAGIGCEQCHGPKNPGHYATGTQPKSMDAKLCGQCHDEPWRHNIYSMWSNAGHSDPPWSNSHSSAGSTIITDYTLSTCVRCHDGKAFVNFTKGESFDNRRSSGYSKLTRTEITCQTCHNPHSAELRVAPAAGDTLANAYNYSTVNFGKGKICVNCHKFRRNGNTYVATQSAASFSGPHHLGAADTYLGQNGYTFGQSLPSSVGHRLVENACVGCHMSATPDTGSVARDHIGGHSWNMEYTGPDSVEYNNVTKCVDCHTGITSFEDIVAAYDYDVDGTQEPFMREVDGLLDLVAMELPPYGSTTIDRSLIAADPDSAVLKKIYWNYLYVTEDKSRGAHNPKYVIGLLQTSLRQVTDIDFSRNEPIPTEYVLTQNYPNPFNPTTKIRVGLSGASPAVLTVYNILGEKVITLMDDTYDPGVYDLTWDGRDQSGRMLAGGIYIYRLQTPEFTSVKKMVFLK
ncbi:MAG TPA: multiheme c-type cytochrome [Bacteroidota bacterium]|nr:multiheme c-type cytochrome [Bacteroidota bacterium]